MMQPSHMPPINTPFHPLLYYHHQFLGVGTRIDARAAPWYRTVHQRGFLARLPT